MNKRSIWILALLVWSLLIMGVVGFAYDWQAANIKVVDTVKAGDTTTLTLQDKDQHLFKVTYSGNNLSDDVAKAIIKYKTEFFAWRNLEMREIKFVYSLDILNIIIIPSRITYNGANIAYAIPAGIIFIYDPTMPGSGLQYDLKILKENLIARVNGKYNTEADFDKNLFRVYDNPKAYPNGLVETTPTPTGKSIGTPSGRPEGKLTVTPTGTPTGQIPKPTNADGSTWPTGTPVRPNPTGAALTNADFEFLLDKIIQLQVENERLRAALLALENRGLFKQAEPVSREVTLQVIRLKRQYPTLTFN
jgi:hypothetical protein